MLDLTDRALPGLQALNESSVQRICGTDRVELVRLRYRPGDRAILHIACHDTPGSQYPDSVLWFFRGNKGKRLARRNPGSHYDEPTQAFFQRFPDDHRMPVIKQFLLNYRQIAPALVGGSVTEPPKLLRYRPGLACTFSCRRDDGGLVYVKMVNGEDVAQLAVGFQQLSKHLNGSKARLVRCLGTLPDYCAIAYESARGDSLEDWLANQPLPQALAAVQRSIDGLRSLSALSVHAQRTLDEKLLMQRARASSEMIQLTLPDAAGLSAAVLSQLQRSVVPLARKPIHGDMKLEHVFVARDPDEPVTLIDMDSISVGDPDYDLAQLDARLHVAQCHAHVPLPVISACRAIIREQSGQRFSWCRRVAALRVAKFFAQRPGPGATAMACQLLEPYS